MTDTKYKFRLVPRPHTLAYTMEYSIWIEYEGHPSRWGSWKTVCGYEKEPYYFETEATARAFLKEYKQWLAKEVIEIGQETEE